MLKILLKVAPGSGGDYWWVTCAGCEGSWQVPHYAESIGVTANPLLRRTG